MGSDDSRVSSGNLCKWEVAERRFRANFRDLRITIELTVEEGELLAALWRMEATHVATGTSVRGYTGVNIFRIMDGRIVEVWNTRDDFGLYAQVGVIPPRSELAPQPFGSAMRE